ncbi:MAG: hypothetical protein AAFV95_12405 [Bacteroidota bacterium]
MTNDALIFSGDDLQHQHDALLEVNTQNHELQERITALENQLSTHLDIVMHSHHTVQEAEQRLTLMAQEHQHRIDIVIHLTEEKQNLQDRIEELESLVEQQKDAAIHTFQENQALHARIDQLEKEAEVLSAQAMESSGIDMTDLKIVEGIGPKTEQALKEAGIIDLKTLSEKSPAHIKSILNKAKGRLRSADPTTWPRQAGMAAEGKMDELKKWQDELDGGRE